MSDESIQKNLQVDPAREKSFHLEQRHWTSTPISAPPAQHRQRDKEYIWVVLWMLWGIVAGLAFGESGDRTRIIAPLLGGAILGMIGGLLGEKHAAKRAGIDLVVYWAAFWSVVWVIVDILILLFSWAIAKLGGQKIEGVFGAVVLAVLLSVGKGTLGGTLGGVIRSMMNRRRKEPAAEGALLISPKSTQITDHKNTLS
jgi:hypothetical protein